MDSACTLICMWPEKREVERWNIFQGSKSTSCLLNYISVRWVAFKMKKPLRARDANGSNDRFSLQMAMWTLSYLHEWHHGSYIWIGAAVVLVSVSESWASNKFAVSHVTISPCVIFLAWQFEPSLQRAIFAFYVTCDATLSEGGKLVNSVSFSNGVSGRYVTVEIAPSARRWTKRVKENLVFTSLIFAEFKISLRILNTDLSFYP